MRAHEFAAAASSAGFGEDFHHADERLGIVASLQHEAHAQRIAFQLVIATEFRRAPLHQHLADHLAGVRAAVLVGKQYRHALSDAGPHLRVRHLLIRMTAHHVPHLMSQHARELVLVLQATKQGLRDENLPARQREGIDGLRIGQQMKLKAIRRLLRSRGGQQTLPHLLHQSHRRGIARGATHFTDHARRRLQPQRHFFLRRGNRQPLRAPGELIRELRRAHPIVNHRAHDEEQPHDDARIAAHTALWATVGGEDSLTREQAAERFHDCFIDRSHPSGQAAPALAFARCFGLMRPSHA